MLSCGGHCSSLRSGEADACFFQQRMLKEDHATMMTQFLIAGLITKCCSEVEGTPVSPGIEEMQKFAVKAARCQYNQRQESLVVVM